MAKSKAATQQKAFGDSETDRRVSGVADRRNVLQTGYVFNEYPKMVFHKDGKQSRVVTDEAAHDALGGDWGADVPEIHKDDETHEAAVLKGDGVPRTLAVQKVEVVNPKDDTRAAAFQQPGAPVDTGTSDEDDTPAGRQRRADAAKAKK